MAGDGGSLSGMSTTARLPLRTEEIQAVLIPEHGPPPALEPGAPPGPCPTAARR